MNTSIIWVEDDFFIINTHEYLLCILSIIYTYCLYKSSKHQIVLNKFYDDVPHRLTYVSDRGGNSETCKFKWTENL